MRLTPLFTEFFESEKAGSIILIACTLASLLIANSDFQIPYLNFWNYPAAGHDISHWVNDGLMTIFFLLIGLELEREIHRGELSSVQSALLPFVAAIGGLIAPALFHF